MNIIKKSHENLTPEQLYFLTKSPAVNRMSDVPADQPIHVSKWCVYEEPEKVNAILAIMDENTGCSYATNSATFARAFAEIVDIFGTDGFAVSVMHGKSNNGRDFITAVYCREV